MSYKYCFCCHQISVRRVVDRLGGYLFLFVEEMVEDVEDTADFLFALNLIFLLLQLVGLILIGLDVTELSYFSINNIGFCKLGFCPRKVSQIDNKITSYVSPLVSCMHRNKALTRHMKACGL